MCRGFGELFFSFFEKNLDFLKQVFFHDGSVGASGVVHIFLATVLGLLEGHSRAAIGFLIVNRDGDKPHRRIADAHKDAKHHIEEIHHHTRKQADTSPKSKIICEKPAKPCFVQFAEDECFGLPK